MESDTAVLETYPEAKSDAKQNIKLWMRRWAPIPIRLMVGCGFILHGYAKLSRGIGSFATILHSMAVPAPQLMSALTIAVELLGGLAVLMGAFVTLASIPMAMVLLVAAVTVHLPYGFSAVKLIGVTAGGAQFGPPGYELDLVYLACLAALVLGGSGPLSVDAMVGRWKTRANVA